MDQKPNPENPVRFGVFEADLNSVELRKSGVRLRLSGQPFQVLAVLLRNPGKIVSREDLKQELWPDDTFVDFENGVNTAIRKIRRVLDDSADTLRYVETLPRRGYRFIGQVEGLPRDGSLSAAPDAQAVQMPSGSPAPSPTAVEKGQQFLPWLLFALTAMALLVVSLLHFRQTPAEARLRRFALAPEDLFRGPVISPDGRRIAYTTRTSNQSTLWVQDLDQDEPRQLAGPGNYLYPFWSSDSSFIAFRAGRELKKVSVQGGPPTTLCELPPRTGERIRGTWSPDGNWIVLNAGSPSRLYQVPSQGGTPKLAFENGRDGLLEQEGLSRCFLHTGPEPHPAAGTVACRSAALVRRLTREAPQIVQESAAMGIVTAPLNDSSGHSLPPYVAGRLIQLLGGVVPLR